MHLPDGNWRKCARARNARVRAGKYCAHVRAAKTPPAPSACVRRRTAWEDAALPSSQAPQVLYMGPALRQGIFTKIKSGKWRKKNNLSATVSFEECVGAALTHLVEPAVDGYAHEIFESSGASKKASEKTIGDIPEGPITKRLDEAEKTYIEQVTEVDNAYALEEIRKFE